MERLQSARFGWIAVSLVYFDALMSVSGLSTSSELSLEDRAAAGISAGLLRLSIGYTSTLEQRLEQLEVCCRALPVCGPEVAMLWRARQVPQNSCVCAGGLPGCDGATGAR